MKTKVTTTFFRLLLVLSLILIINTSFLTDKSSNANDFVLFEIENEESLELEDWMMNDDFFNESVYFKTETEESLELEDWMLNENNFQ